jgi:hypothetical protein
MARAEALASLSASRMLKKVEFHALSFDRLRRRPSDFNGLDLMVTLSRFGGLTVRPWAASFFSSLLGWRLAIA